MPGALIFDFSFVLQVVLLMIDIDLNQMAEKGCFKKFEAMSNCLNAMINVENLIA